MTGEGIDDLLIALGDRLRAATRAYELFIPWARGDALAAAHREGEVLDEVSEEEGMRLTVRLEASSASRLREFIVAGAEADTEAGAAGADTNGHQEVL